MSRAKRAPGTEDVPSLPPPSPPNGKPRKPKLTDKQVEECLQAICWHNNSWGQLERLAGVTDREAFWKGKTETQASKELRDIIRERIRNGGLGQHLKECPGKELLTAADSDTAEGRQ